MCQSWLLAWGYATLPGKNSFTEYIYENVVAGNIYVDNIAKIIPDYHTHSWFLIPQRTGKYYVEPPTKDKISKGEDYMITMSYPFTKQGVFQGVFVFDIALKWLAGDLSKYNVYDDVKVGLFFTEDKYNFYMMRKDEITISKFRKNEMTDDYLKEVYNSNGKNYIHKKIKGYSLLAISTPVLYKSIYLVSYFDELLIINTVNYLFYRELITCMIFLVIVFVAIFLVIKFSLKPIVQISNNVRKIAKGDLDTDISVRSSTIEVIRLQEAIRKIQIHLRHYIKQVQKNAELNTEMKIARDIQMSVIPKANPTFEKFPKFDLCHYFKSTKEVSGDFYNYYMIDDDNLFISIGGCNRQRYPCMSLYINDG